MAYTDQKGLAVSTSSPRRSGVRARARPLPPLARQSPGGPQCGGEGRPGLRGRALRAGPHRLAGRTGGGRLGRPPRGHGASRPGAGRPRARPRPGGGRHGAGRAGAGARAPRAGVGAIPTDRLIVRSVGLNCIARGRLRGRHGHRPPEHGRRPGRAAVHDHDGVLPRAVRLQRGGARAELPLARPRPDEPLHLPRGGARLSGAGRLPPRARDVRAGGLARAPLARPVAPGRGAVHPRATSASRATTGARRRRPCPCTSASSSSGASRCSRAPAPTMPSGKRWPTRPDDCSSTPTR